MASSGPVTRLGRLRMARTCKTTHTRPILAAHRSQMLASGALRWPDFGSHPHLSLCWPLPTEAADVRTRALREGSSHETVATDHLTT